MKLEKSKPGKREKLRSTQRNYKAATKKTEKYFFT